MKISVEDIFENNEFLDGKLSEYIFTHIDINNNGSLNEDKIYEYKKIDFYKNFISQKLKEFNNGYNDNIYQELIINNSDYEYLQNILFFFENNLSNKKILILLEGNKLFKELILKFCAFLCGAKIIECRKNINSKSNLNKIFEEIVLNNKKIYYLIKENILEENNEAFNSIKNILIPEEFIKYIDIKLYDQEKKIDIHNAIKLIESNLKIVLDIKSHKNIKEIYYLKDYSRYIRDSAHIIYQMNWIKKDYKFYLDYSFSKSNTIKEIKYSTNYNNIKKNLFEIIYNTYLFSCELINKINNNNNENILLLNNYIDAVHIFLNYYETNYNIIKEKYLIYENCNPSHKIINFIKKIKSEIYELGNKKDEIEKKENEFKKSKQTLYIERQSFNKIISEYEKNIDEKNNELIKITYEIDEIINPILKNIEKSTEECLSYNEISFNELKYSYENSNLGKLILVSLYILASDTNDSEINHTIWDITKRNLNIKMLNTFFEKKVYINYIKNKVYIKLLQNIFKNNEFQKLINNLNNENYSKSPFISLKKFCKYFYACYNYYKVNNKIEVLNQKKLEVKKEIENLNEEKNVQKAKLNENKKKNLEFESLINSIEKEKSNNLFSIKCHNDLMTITNNYFEKLDEIIPDLLKKRIIYQDILSHFVSYHLVLSLYYSFAPIFDRKNRILLQKYIYSQVNKYNKNEIKEFTFLEIFYNFLDIIHNDNENENSNKAATASKNYMKNKNLLFSLYKYLDFNKLNITDENNFILENIIFIDFFKNRAICLDNKKNPGLSNSVLINIFKDQKKKESKENMEDKKENQNQNNKNNLNNLPTNINISNDIIINYNNWIYHLIEINLNKYKIDRDLEYISKILEEGLHGRNKRLLIFIINNCNKDNLYLFQDLINNSDNKKRASIFYLGKNKISLNSQIRFRIFFSYKDSNYDLSRNPSITNGKYINFNANSNIIKLELENFLAGITDLNYLNLFKENRFNLIKLSLEKELIYIKLFKKIIIDFL